MLTFFYLDEFNKCDFYPQNKQNLIKIIILSVFDMSEGCSTEIIVSNMWPAWHVFGSPVVNVSKKYSLSMDNLHQAWQFLKIPFFNATDTQA
jgi:hypothetical protein